MYTKGKKGGIYLFFITKWMWTSEDGPKGIEGWF